MSVLEAMARAICCPLHSVEEPGGCPRHNTGLGCLASIGLARSALAAARRQGWQLVPVEPTKNQEHDGGSVFDHPSVFMGGPSHGGRKKSTAIYRAMLSSAPSIEEG